MVRGFRSRVLAGALGVVLAAIGLGASVSGAAGPDPDRPSSRIINGEVAPPGSWPSIVRVNGCGGTLIEPEWVLTAGHCEVKPGDVAVLGRHDLRDKSVGEGIPVAESFTHPRYGIPQTAGLANDYALLRLERPSSQPAMPIAAADRSDDPVAGEVVAAAGWGITEKSSKQSKVLRQTTLNAWSDKACRKARNTGGRQDPRYNLCALYSVEGEPVRDTCNGDSGGPLTVTRDGTEILVGMTSYGPFACAKRGAPGVYARVSNARGWIARVSGRHVSTDFSELELDGAGASELGAPSVVTLRSDGVEPVTLSDIEIDPGFELTGGTCTEGATLAPDASCTVEVAMRGTGAPQSGELRIGTDSDDEPEEQIALSGVPGGSPPPDTAIVERPQPTVGTRSGRARLGFSFTASSPEVDFECAFGSADERPRFRRCASPARFAARIEGSRQTAYMLRVRAVGEAGVDRTPASARVLLVRRR